MTTELLFNRKFLKKKVNVNTCQYPDVSIWDRSDFTLNFSSELCKIVRHLSLRFPLLEVFGRPRIWTAGSDWKTYDLKGFKGIVIQAGSRKGLGKQTTVNITQLVFSERFNLEIQL